MTATKTTAQAISTIRSNYAARRRLAASGDRTMATVYALSDCWSAIRMASKKLPRGLFSALAYENALLEEIAVSRRNGVEQPELAGRLANCRRHINASA